MAFSRVCLKGFDINIEQIHTNKERSTCACERFQEYLIGKSSHLHMDHKPLVPIFITKSLEELPLRVQQFRLRFLRFQFTISHIPGKELSTFDTLSQPHYRVTHT